MLWLWLVHDKSDDNNRPKSDSNNRLGESDMIPITINNFHNCENYCFWHYIKSNWPKGHD